MSVLVFIAFFISILIDPRLYFVEDLKLYYPTFLYAYIALFVQGGALQAVGCVAALKLNEKMINIYWFMMVALVAGDILIGVVWLLRYDQVTSNLKADLKEKLYSSYGVDEEYTQLWNALEKRYQCCGVEGSSDYENIDVLRFSRKKFPSECCIIQVNDSVTEFYATTETPDSDNDTDTTEAQYGHVSRYSDNDWTKFSDSEVIFQYKQMDKSVADSAERNPKMLSKGVHSSIRKIDSDNENITYSYFIPKRSKVYKKHQEIPRLSSLKAKINETMSESLKKYPSQTTTSLFSNFYLRKTTKAPYHFIHQVLKNTKSKNNIPTKNRKNSVSNLLRTKKLEVTEDPQLRFLNCSHDASSDDPAGCGDNIYKWLQKSSNLLFVLGYWIIILLKAAFVGILKYEIKEMIGKIQAMQQEAEQEAMAEMANLTPREDLNNINKESAAIQSVFDSIQNTPMHVIRANHLAELCESDTNSNSALITDTPVKTKPPNGNNNEIHEMRELPKGIKQTAI